MKLQTVLASAIALSAVATPAFAGEQYLRTKFDATLKDGNRSDTVTLQQRIGYKTDVLYTEFGLGGSFNGNDEAIAALEVGVTKDITKDLKFRASVEPIYYFDSENLDIRVKSDLYIKL